MSNEKRKDVETLNDPDQKKIKSESHTLNLKNKIDSPQLKSKDSTHTQAIDPLEPASTPSPTLPKAFMVPQKPESTWDDLVEETDSKPIKPPTKTPHSTPMTSRFGDSNPQMNVKFGETTPFGAKKSTIEMSAKFGETTPFGKKKVDSSVTPMNVKFNQTAFFGTFKPVENDLTKKENAVSFGKLKNETSFERLLKTADSDEEEDEEEQDKPLFQPLDEITTGEEEEVTVCSLRCKLFHLDEEHQWKERGVGIIHINTDKVNGKGRLVMRTDAVFRLILNISIIDNMKCEIVQDKFLRIVGFESGVPCTFLLRFGNPVAANELFEHIISISINE